MNRTWRIFKHEYTRHVLRKRFLLALLSVPLWVLAMVVMGVVSVLLQVDRTPVGVIDQSGILAGVELVEDDPDFTSVPFVRYDSETQAAADLQSEKLQAYIILPANYLASRAARMVYLEEPDGVRSQFNEILVRALLSEQPDAVKRRVLQGPDIVIQATAEDRPVETGDWFKVASPIVAGIFLIVSVFTSAGYLLASVVEEKENRTIEILATSLSPTQIMTGKVTALICVGLTQVLVWSLFPILGVLLARAYVPFLQTVTVDPKLVLLIFLTALPTFVLISSLMAAIGATVTESREGQQVSGLISMLVMVPFMLMSAIVTNPNGAIPLAMSFFPLTSALTLLLRMGVATVPGWQITLSVGLLIVSAVGSLWFAGRVFRFGMLRYGKRMGWRDVFSALRPERRTVKEAA